MLFFVSNVNVCNQFALIIKLDKMLLIIDITVYLTVYRLRYYVILFEQSCAVNYQQNFKFLPFPIKAFN